MEAMLMDEIKRGDQVLARTALGQRLSRRALGGVVMGKDFKVVWVCSEEEWQEAQRQHREPQGWAWPAEDVQAAHPESVHGSKG
jgi:hypothetical protein